MLASHQQATPITLNMIVSSLLLQTGAIHYNLNQLVSDIRKIWKYLRGLKLYTMLTMEPSVASIELEVKSLGFKIQNIFLNVEKTKRIKGLNNKTEPKSKKGN
jgi:hypothetical protein